MMTEHGKMWKKMRESARSQFFEAVIAHGDPEDTDEIAGLVANQVARDFLTSHETYTQFLADDPQLLWRHTHTEDCETIEDILFEFAEGDLTQFLLDDVLPLIAFPEEDYE